ncbi:MAG: glycine--tRNA ligase subunit beta [Saezia sp.]
MNMQNLLVELFVEELPPKALKNLGEAFSQVLAQSLREQGLCTEKSIVTAYASPRRLAVHVTQVLEQAEDKAVSTRLMPANVGLDKQGSATPALLKRLEGLGADASAVSRLKRVDDGKNEMLYFDSIASGATLAAGLQIALDSAIAKLPIPKVMGYQLQDGWSTVHFVRPVHAIVALYGDKVVPVGAFGLQSDRKTKGHRFEAKLPVIEVKHSDAYAQQLEEEGAVIACFEQRKAMIKEQLQAAAQKAGGAVQPIQDEALLDEVTALVERPNVLTCQFEKEFLEVPQECLILTMKANQKYFPLMYADGRLSHQFLVVSNISPQDTSAIVQGNERVVRPRLADAKFFYDQDRKKPLSARTERYGKVVYHNQLGTLADRVVRMRAIGAAIVKQLGIDLSAQVDQAILLAKADLLTDMVGEFPELQGIMGRYYALHDGLSADVAQAIEDHYKPRFAGDVLPANQVGVIAALADKLETLMGMFGTGNLPTGDRDPFALRRHALGVIRILLEKQPTLRLDQLLAAAAEAFVAGQNNVTAEFKNPCLTVADFIYERLSGVMSEQGYSAKEIDAVLALRPQQLADVRKRLEAVHAFAVLPQAPALAAANKRVGNILKKSDDESGAQVNQALLKEDAEIALEKALRQAQAASDMAYEAGDYTRSLKELAVLKAPVDAFFDSVMVNAEDANLRRNRLGLLSLMHQVMNRVADLARLA